MRAVHLLAQSSWVSQRRAAGSPQTACHRFAQLVEPGGSKNTRPICSPNVTSARSFITEREDRCVAIKKHTLFSGDFSTDGSNNTKIKGKLFRRDPFLNSSYARSPASENDFKLLKTVSYFLVLSIDLIVRYLDNLWLGPATFSCLATHIKFKSRSDWSGEALISCNFSPTFQ